MGMGGWLVVLVYVGAISVMVLIVVMMVREEERETRGVGSYSGALA